MTAKHGDIWRSPCGTVELRCGRYQDVLADVECDHVISDPPYSARTHGGQCHGRRNPKYEPGCSTRGIGYASWTDDDVLALAQWTGAACDGWLAAHTSSGLIPAYERAAEIAGRTRFAPLPCVLRGMNVRLAGDGPSNWSVYLMVSRPKSLTRWGTLPGAYVGNPGRGVERAKLAVVGAKPIWLMRAIVRDYSRPGDLICDPCAGGGTTLLAAAIEGRRAIGAEMDPETYEKAVKRLSKGWTKGTLWEPEQVSMEQTKMEGM